MLISFLVKPLALSIAKIDAPVIELLVIIIFLFFKSLTEFIPMSSLTRSTKGED